MAENSLEIFASGKGVHKSTPTPNNPGSLTATYLTDGITVPSTNEDLLRTSPHVSKSFMAKIHCTHVDESVHTLKSPIYTEIPVVLKNLSKGRGTNYSKQETIFLAKTFIRASTDLIIGTSQTEQHFSQKVCNIYNQKAENYNKQNATANNFVPYTS